MVAGIDVGAFKHAVAVGEEVRFFDATAVDDLIFYLHSKGVNRVILEPTGIYHIPLSARLVEEGFNVFMVHSTRFGRLRGALMRKKGDKEDAALLAKAEEIAKEYLYEIDKQWINAKMIGLIVQEHARITKDITRETNRIRRDLYIVDPSLAFMVPSSYKVENFESIDFSDMTQYIIKRIEHLEDLRSRKKKLEKEIKTFVLEHEDGKILITIPGISHITAGLLISTYVSIDRFKSVKHFKAFMGFGLNDKQSGESIKVVKGSKAHIPIRSAMFRVVISNVNKDNKISEYYHRYRKRMPFKKAVMRTGAKIIEWIYHMLKNKEGWRDDD